MIYFLIFCLCVSTISGAPQGPSRKITTKELAPRIINGYPAYMGQFPWQAAMWIVGHYSWFCGGTIISKDWILTAAHCIQGATRGRVITGVISLNDPGATETNISQFIPHEHHNQMTLENDIGLVKLSSPLVFDEYTKPATLVRQFVEPFTSIIVSGYGHTTHSGPISQTLNFVPLKTITTAECEMVYGIGEVFPGIVCAASVYNAIRSTCNGDSGGPVVLYNPNVSYPEPLHVATVSFVSARGCESGDPTGYTRTAYYLKWIKNITDIP